MKRCLLGLVLVYMVGSAAVGHAVSVGVFSYDSLIPGPDGVNTFSITNLTGDPGNGGFALPPDFPVVTSLSFRQSGINIVFADGSVRTLSLGNLGPGPFPDPASDLQFPDTTEIHSARFTAELSETSLLLADGSIFLASASLSGRLLPASGDFLLAGSDFIILEVTPRSMSEPGGWILMAAGIGGLWAIRRIRAL